jgi:hypothetical protein
MREWRVRKQDEYMAATNIQRIARGFVGRIRILHRRFLQVRGIRQRYKLARIVQRLWQGCL